jgi:hypothetical protein
MVQLGLLIKVDRGIYRRVGIAGVQKALGLGSEFATVRLPRAAYTESPAVYFRHVLLAIEHYLPEGLAASTIAKAAGISRNTLYKAEDDLGVDRRKKAIRVLPAPAAEISFIKVFDAKGNLVTTISGNDSALAKELAAHFEGKAWGWRWLHSVRILPKIGPKNLVPKKGKY